MKVPRLHHLIVVTFIILEGSQAARILAAFVYPGPSHYMMFKTLMRELIQRGHEITCITALPMDEGFGKNYTEILIEPVYEYWAAIQDHFGASNILDMANLGYHDTLKLGEIIGEKTTEHALKQSKVQEVFNRTDTRDVYDLLLVEQFFQEPFLALAVKYDIPVVSACTLGPLAYFSQMMGFIHSWSFVPQGYIPLDESMTFLERVQNTLACMYEYLFKEFMYFPRHDALVEKYLSHLPVKIPKVSKMERIISVILVNNYTPLSTPRSTVAGIIEIGGMHIYPPKPLVTDVKEFLDKATHGAVYFSFGSNIRACDMDPKKIRMILDVFASMRQRFLWKFEDETIIGVPRNVMIKKWMPQNSILAHPNVKVFITHGGLFGTLEAIHYGIPMLGIPIYSDQHVNVKRATRSGFGLSLNYETMDKESFKNSLLEVLMNPSFKENMQRASNIFHDRPMSARDTAVYWIEYVIRHKGAKHLRLAGLDLAWYEFYLLDVFGFLLLIAIVPIVGIYIGLKMLIKSKRIKEKAE